MRRVLQAMEAEFLRHLRQSRARRSPLLHLFM